MESLAKRNNEQLTRIEPKTKVQPVPRPKQGVQFARGASVTKFLRQYTKEKNAGKGNSEPRYEEFLEDVTDRQYNTDAMNTLEWILGLHLGSDLGVRSWEQVCKQSPGKMGLIMQDAVRAPELRVFAQAARQWAIQMLITNKMNSRIRYNRERMSQGQVDNMESNFAPMSVPDIEHNNATSDANMEEMNSHIEDEPEYIDQRVREIRGDPELFHTYPSAFNDESTLEGGMNRQTMFRRTRQHQNPNENLRSSRRQHITDNNNLARGQSSASARRLGADRTIARERSDRGGRANTVPALRSRVVSGSSRRQRSATKVLRGAKR